MRKWFASLAAAALVVTLSAPVAAAPQVRVEVAGQELVADVAPFVENGRTLVPVRALAERLGFDVTWDQASQKVTLSKWPKTLELTIGSDIAVVNGREVKLDVPARIVNDRTVVPLRFVSEHLGAQVSWNQETRTASVEPPGPLSDLAWALLRKSREAQPVGVKGTGRMTMSWSFRDVPEGLDLPVMPSVSSTMEVQTYGQDGLVTVEATMEGETFTTQTALYQGEIWLNLPDQGWFKVDVAELGEATSMLGLPGDFSLDPVALTRLGEQILADGEAFVVGEEDLDGVHTFKVSLNLTNSPFFTMVFTVPGENMEIPTDVTLERFVLTYWLDENGFTHKVNTTMAMSMPLLDVKGAPVMVSFAAGEFWFQPNEEPVIFPPEITGETGEEPAAEEPAEEIPAEEPAEEQPTEGQPDSEAPVEAPAEEAPAA